MTEKTPKEKADDIFQTLGHLAWLLIKWYIIVQLVVGGAMIAFIVLLKSQN